jgi:hypothetical protein
MPPPIIQVSKPPPPAKPTFLHYVGITAGSVLGVAVYGYVARRSQFAAAMLPIIPIALVVFLIRKFGKLSPPRRGERAEGSGKPPESHAP